MIFSFLVDDGHGWVAVRQTYTDYTEAVARLRSLQALYGVAGVHLAVVHPANISPRTPAENEAVRRIWEDQRRAYRDVVPIIPIAHGEDSTQTLV